MEETWKDITGYENIYQVSNLGRVRSVDRHVYRYKNGASDTPSLALLKGKILSPTNNGKGYMIVFLRNKSRKNHYVHRLVAIHFIENPNSHNEVNHIDGNKSNNISLNLEWVSKKENAEHAVKNVLVPLRGEKTNAIMVLDIKTSMVFETIKSAAEYFGIKYGLLKEALNRRSYNKKPIYKRLVKLPEYIKDHPEEAKRLKLSESRLKK